MARDPRNLGLVRFFSEAHSNAEPPFSIINASYPAQAVGWTPRPTGFHFIRWQAISAEQQHGILDNEAWVSVDLGDRDVFIAFTAVEPPGPRMIEHARSFVARHLGPLNQILGNSFPKPAYAHVQLDAPLPSSYAVIQNVLITRERTLDPLDLEEVLVHEFVHVFQGRGLPICIIEGMADDLTLHLTGDQGRRDGRGGYASFADGSKVSLTAFELPIDEYRREGGNGHLWLRATRQAAGDGAVFAAYAQLLANQSSGSKALAEFLTGMKAAARDPQGVEAAYIRWIEGYVPGSA